MPEKIEIKNARQLSPEELSEKMSYCTYEFEEANRGIRRLEEEGNKTLREKEVGALVAAKNWRALTNEVAKVSLHKIENECVRITKDIIDDITFIELQEITNQYNYYEMIAKQAAQEYSMWQGQLLKYQSDLKFEGIQMMNKL